MGNEDYILDWINKERCIDNHPLNLQVFGWSDAGCDPFESDTEENLFDGVFSSPCELLVSFGHTV